MNANADGVTDIQNRSPTGERPLASRTPPVLQLFSVDKRVLAVRSYSSNSFIRRLRSGRVVGSLGLRGIFAGSGGGSRFEFMMARLTSGCWCKGGHLRWRSVRI